jgi:hypothetical protein
MKRYRDGSGKPLANVFLAVLVLALICFSSDSMNSSAQTQKATQSSQVFVWFFGYVGNNFYPRLQLDITPKQTLQEAKLLSTDLNSTSVLRFVSTVDEIPGEEVSWSNLSQVQQIKNYVVSLQSYGQVYGRLDLAEFNYTAWSGNTIFSEASRYIKQLSIQGIWLDHAGVLFNSNPIKFNQMMQNLTNQFPGVTFILNQAYHQANSNFNIVPETGTTWASKTYISPSIQMGSYNVLPSKQQLSRWNDSYPGRVLIHFDSFAKYSYEPMGIFANQSKAVEVKTLQKLASEGTPGSVNYIASFSLLYPILGAWTYGGNGSEYQGTMYNSFTSGYGIYDRGTIKNFAEIMANP